MGAGLQTGVPQQLYGLWVTTQKFSWNTQQPNGTLLGSLSLSPEIHPFLAVLSTIYAGWSGGMNIRVLLSASGIYGGRLLICVLPPGIRPSSVTNPTAFPCAILDARLTTPLELMMPDIRQVAYHSTTTADTTTTIAIYVNAPLINPFSGTNTHLAAVDVALYVAPAPDFAFCLLKEPTSLEASIATILGNNTAEWYENRTADPVNSIRFVDQVVQSWNHFDCYGNTTGWGDCTVRGRLKVRLNVYPSGSHNHENECWYDASFYAGNSNANLEHGTDQFMPLVPHFPDFVYNLPDWAHASGNFSHFTGYTSACWQGIGYYENDGTYSAMAPSSNATAILGWGMITGQPGASSNTSTDMVGTPTTATGRALIYLSKTPADNYTGFDFICSFIYLRRAQNKTTVCKLLGPNAVTATPTGGNKMVEFCSLQPAAWGNMVMPCSQPLVLSKSFMRGNFNIPEGTMAVFRLYNSYASFELGVLPSGYVMAGGGGAGSVDFGIWGPNPSHYDIRFTGFAPISSVLVSPKTVGSSFSLFSGHGNGIRSYEREL